jgi:chromosome segregation ATPase
MIRVNEERIDSLEMETENIREDIQSTTSGISELTGLVQNFKTAVDSLNERSLKLDSKMAVLATKEELNVLATRVNQIESRLSKALDEKLKEIVDRLDTQSDVIGGIGNYASEIEKICDIKFSQIEERVSNQTKVIVNLLSDFEGKFANFDHRFATVTGVISALNNRIIALEKKF